MSLSAQGITQTVTRPSQGDRLNLEITLLGGTKINYEVNADAYYRAIKDLLKKETLLTEKPLALAPPSTFDPAA